ncbi:signal peptidase II [Nanchangia anserum]|uniref:Lipoprotein signal peptidase n=1 Tax=Nanchangia anserum TaxID=2692125 RepID=A0A8I0KPD4_9ACTO|nr:signal peptidase II [Nanchangia anserum]MBD3690231.1 signal peptidase II [Nanchangia anserum]QOX82324.1 signal peptidase II [Nanchangia anserum]
MRPINWRSFAYFYGAVTIPTLLIDQVTKALAVARLEPNEAYPLLGSLLSLQLVRNPGAAFSFASSSTWVFTVVACVVIAAVAYIAPHVEHRWWLTVLGLLVGGAMGNLIDRLIQPPAFGSGHVVDFLNYGGLFIGNVADIAIVAAVIGVVGLTLAGVPLGSPRRRRVEARQ